MSARSRSKTLIKAKGIFPGALVVRGMDWKWGDQDGERHILYEAM